MNLNLARKWRSHHFDTIVGQELSVKMLKNSLYLGHYFPVYLFSGQRGCGKTTTARVFSAALNCEKLSAFQKQPQKYATPCQTCASCKAMQSGRHPDFIEIDAASHTGVDHVRSIVEAASYLPVMGQKKIYLIDEAHMLSKAAFNALLKILEEPPPSVVFMLATTDPYKIIETVRSRSFQLFFKPVGHRDLIAHLKNVCTQENIRFDVQGLQAIVQASDGSVRDALNLIERARFSNSAITKKGVLALLGHLDDVQAVRLFELLFAGDPQSLLAFLHEIQLSHFSATAVWQTLVNLVRATLWIAYGAQPPHFQEQVAVLKKISAKCSVQQLHEFATYVYEHEQYFMRTSAQHELLELLLLRMCQKNNDGSDGSSGTSGASSEVSTSVYTTEEDDCHEDEEAGDEQTYAGDDTDVEPTDQSQQQDGQHNGRWQEFIRTIEYVDDPLVISIFKQAGGEQYEDASGMLTVVFPENLAFFHDWLEQTRHIWMPHIRAVYGESVSVQPVFTGQRVQAPPKLERSQGKKDMNHRDVQSVPTSGEQKEKRVATAKHRSNDHKYGAAPGRLHAQSKAFGGGISVCDECAVDVSDASVWKQAAQVMTYFPGKITELYACDMQSTHSSMQYESDQA